jgi:hypothetical protein
LITNSVKTEDILAQLEAGPLDSFALAKILKRAHVAVLSKLENLLEADKVLVETNRTTGLPEYSLAERPHCDSKPPSIAGGRYVPEITPLRGYESSLMAFRDVCMLTRR